MINKIENLLFELTYPINSNIESVVFPIRYTTNCLDLYTIHDTEGKNNIEIREYLPKDFFFLELENRHKPYFFDVNTIIDNMNKDGYFERLK